ncbi:MAG TPA: N-carbamoylputrescine amidase [Candidatus Ignatzschineria merdigallinarum]|uniref:N-carbamoylputrescine amidase n=1 Tax=Candidatus Ignatzschineria merdigallinarum TaxID=2838621 RepID=A0A9D1Q7S1_9GAMM|nr:N-carbamoylputrescine amidase [Candidatus Ignatzschineria merdigallinarum]
MKVRVSAVQMKMTWDIESNLQKAEMLVREAAAQGANIVLLPEFFQSPYFMQVQNYDYFELAQDVNDSSHIRRFQKLAKELNVVLPLSFFERAGNVFFNSLVMIDADGEIIDLYRKTHIPDGHCYQEKFYFSPGDTGFKVFETQFGKIGVGICWDQWFPETARSLALMGAEMIFYPTAIGNEPILEHDSKSHWQNTMCGHAAANIMPVIAANRIGQEDEPAENSSMTFYGSSFISNEEGIKVAEMDRESEGVIIHEFDLEAIGKKRISWGVFRDRRPEFYEAINHMDFRI